MVINSNIGLFKVQVHELQNIYGIKADIKEDYNFKAFIYLNGFGELQ